MPKSRNRVHSQAHSTATLVSNEKNGVKAAHPNMPIGNPINNAHSGSGSSLNASTILAATMDREAQRERDNYTATVRSKFS